VEGRVYAQLFWLAIKAYLQFETGWRPFVRANCGESGGKALFARRRAELPGHLKDRPVPGHLPVENQFPDAEPVDCNGWKRFRQSKRLNCCRLLFRCRLGSR